MKHLGSVTDINGAEIDPVDIITFGSPCQDLSVAGKRAGLKHEANGDEETTRSGLFMEAVRIIKEMRRATNGLYPTFAIWENVPGAFSSNKGEDFRIVLEELIKIVEPGAVMPTVPQKGWAYADSYLGDGWSLAYRTLDAQYWGVPQRRRRIYLVLDLRGERAKEILFEREGLRGYFTEGRAPWKATARNAENCPGADDSQRAGSGVTPVCMATQQGGAEIRTDDKAPTITAAAGMSGNNQPVVCYEAAGFKAGQSMAGGIGWQEETAATLSAQCSGTEPTVCIKEQHLFENHSQDSRYKGPLDVSPMLPAQLGTGGNNQPFVVESKVYESHPMDSRIKELDGVAPTVSRKWHKGAADTPLVCEAMLASGKEVTGCLMASGYEKLGAQEMFSGDYTVIEKQPIPIHDQATRFSGKRGDNSDGKGNGLGVGNPGDPMNTLTSGDRHAVCYTLSHGGFMVNPSDDGIADTLQATDYKDPQVVAFDRAAFNQGQNAQYTPQYYTDGTVPTLVAKGPSGVAYKEAIRYIVRRLTPTECARLQGFPDTWGHINPKEDITDEEYSFWLEVRNTHAAINGKPTKEYTKAQMLTWYNKLHTDGLRTRAPALHRHLLQVRRHPHETHRYLDKPPATQFHPAVQERRQVP